MAISHNNNQSLDSLDLHVPVALDPRNFTSIHRTPWAGQSLAAGIKRNQADSSSQKIGESWEVSCDPEAPSKLRDAPDFTLSQLITKRTVECLSEGLVASGRTTCDILIKLLNADSPLSLQIHPSDNNKSLKANECGKPESWLVLNAKPNSGIYLGFKRELPIQEIRERLENGSFSADLLQFVPVKPGDYFEIEPHVPHAIGPGVVLLEPQRILAGKSGKTWRLWDWNRKYNSAGDLDMQNGKGRELHINEAIPLLNPAQQSGPAYVSSLLKSPTKLNTAHGVEIDIFPANPWYQTISVSMNPQSKLQIRSKAAYGCATMISGSIFSKSSSGSGVAMTQGESYFLPSASLPIELATREGPAHFTIVIPAGQGTSGRDAGQDSSIFC